MKHSAEELRNFTLADSYKPELELSRSVLTTIDVPAPFRRWGEPIRVPLPWGRIEYLNVIAAVETIGVDEQINWEDNIFRTQQIQVLAAPDGQGWLVSGYSFFSFWSPPAAAEPGISVRVKVLATLV